MKRTPIVACIIAVAALLVVAHSVPQDEGRFAVAGLQTQEVESFFISFKEAVARGDKREVAGLISYPIRATVKSGRRVKLANAAAFVKSYDLIFHDEFKRLIATTEPKDLWAKSAGVATPRGEVWFSGIVKSTKPQEVYEIKIIALNGPLRP